MSSEIINMSGSSKSNITYAANELMSQISGELVYDSTQTIGNGEVILMVFEKFFMRNGGYANLTVMLTDDGNNKSAVIVGSGGGEGLFNISWGANSDFANEAKEILEENGFH